LFVAVDAGTTIVAVSVENSLCELQQKNNKNRSVFFMAFYK
jgi:hypothetical protein